MHHIDYAELKANFEHYVEQAYNGEEVVVTRDGEPLVKLVACQPKLPRIGFLKGQFAFDAKAFSAMDKEIEDLFYASEIFPEDSSVAAPGPTKSGDDDKGT